MVKITMALAWISIKRVREVADVCIYGCSYNWGYYKMCAADRQARNYMPPNSILRHKFMEW